MNTIHKIDNTKHKIQKRIQGKSGKHNTKHKTQKTKIYIYINK